MADPFGLYDSGGGSLMEDMGGLNDPNDFSSPHPGMHMAANRGGMMMSQADSMLGMMPPQPQPPNPQQQASSTMPPSQSGMNSYGPLPGPMGMHHSNMSPGPKLQHYNDYNQYGPPSHLAPMNESGMNRPGVPPAGMPSQGMSSPHQGMLAPLQQSSTQSASQPYGTLQRPVNPSQHMGRSDMSGPAVYGVHNNMTPAQSQSATNSQQPMQMNQNQVWNNPPYVHQDQSRMPAQSHTFMQHSDYVHPGGPNNANLGVVGNQRLSHYTDQAPPDPSNPHLAMASQSMPHIPPQSRSIPGSTNNMVNMPQGTQSHQMYSQSTQPMGPSMSGGNYHASPSLMPPGPQQPQRPQYGYSRDPGLRPPHVNSGQSMNPSSKLSHYAQQYGPNGAVQNQSYQMQTPPPVQHSHSMNSADPVPPMPHYSNQSVPNGSPHYRPVYPKMSMSPHRPTPPPPTINSPMPPPSHTPERLAVPNMSPQPSQGSYRSPGPSSSPAVAQSSLQQLEQMVMPHMNNQNSPNPVQSNPFHTVMTPNSTPSPNMANSAGMLAPSPGAPPPPSQYMPNAPAMEGSRTLPQPSLGPMPTPVMSAPSPGTIAMSGTAGATHIPPTPQRPCVSPNSVYAESQNVQQQMQQYYNMPQTSQTRQKIMELEDKLTMLQQQQIAPAQPLAPHPLPQHQLQSNNSSHSTNLQPPTPETTLPLHQQSQSPPPPQLSTESPCDTSQLLNSQPNHEHNDPSSPSPSYMLLTGNNCQPSIVSAAAQSDILPQNQPPLSVQLEHEQPMQAVQPVPQTEAPVVPFQPSNEFSPISAEPILSCTDDPAAVYPDPVTSSVTEDLKASKDKNQEKANRIIMEAVAKAHAAGNVDIPRVLTPPPVDESAAISQPVENSEGLPIVEPKKKPKKNYKKKDPKEPKEPRVKVPKQPKEPKTPKKPRVPKEKKPKEPKPRKETDGTKKTSKSKSKKAKETKPKEENGGETTAAESTEPKEGEVCEEAAKAENSEEKPKTPPKKKESRPKSSSKSSAKKKLLPKAILNFTKKKRKRGASSDVSDLEVTPPPSPAPDEENSTQKRRSARNTKRKKYIDDIELEISDDDNLDLDFDKVMQPDGLPAADGALKPVQFFVNPSEEDSMVVEKIMGMRTVKKEVEGEEEPEEPEEEEEYYVKYKNFSYLHCEWKTQEELEKGDKRVLPKIKRYKQKKSQSSNIFEFLEEELFNPEYVEVDRILDVTETADPQTNETTRHYLVKWRGLSYEESTWETEDDVDKEKIDQFKVFKEPPSKEELKAKKRPKANEWTKMEESRDYKNGNTLREYQLEGLNWLMFSWHNGQNCILADEMGLGKTIQSIAFLYEVAGYGFKGPFLVIAPLSTIANWQREFETWSDLNVIVYHGSSASRNMIQEYEMHFKDEKGSKVPDLYKFHCLITTFEIIISDCLELREIPWRCVIIDEAHRLKNKNCKLLEGLRLMEMEHRVLLSGTPLQNNVEELFSLLNFLEPTQFASSEDFLREFGDLKSESQVQKLQQLLKPMMLRRLKEDVEKSLAPKEETIIEVELTNIQKKYYRAILERNFTFLAKGTTSANVPNLMNTMMELRKCCIHPYLINGAEEQIQSERRITASDPSDSYLQAMIQSSGKLVLIDKLLPKLKANGHRVLVFSQMVRCLDILEDYLIQRRYPYERIDGRVRGNMRQAAIDRFSKPDSDRFVFLLCTRAGGLGINLTAADTVIIFDSDWNPQNDLQAQARCHRIGQQKSVQVYRLICRNTYEREMFDKASLKLGLDKAVLQSMNTSNKEGIGTSQQLSKKEIEDLLRKGAYGAIMEDDNAADQFCEEDIDQILQRRTQVIQLESGVKGSTFAKASFVASDNRTDIEIDDPEFWQKWAKRAEIDMEELNAKNDLIIHEPRRRVQTRRFGNEDSLLELSELDSSDDDDSIGSGRHGRGFKRQTRRRRRRGDERDDDIMDAYAGFYFWSRSDCFKVEKGLLTFGWGRWTECLGHGKFKRKLSERDVEEISRAILLYCLKFYKGDEKIKGFIWDLITPTVDGESKVHKNHSGLSAPVPRGRKSKKNKKELKQIMNNFMDTYDWAKNPKYNPEIILADEGYRRHLQRHANKVLLRVRLLYYVKQEVIGELAFQVARGIPASDIPIMSPCSDSDFPVFWWDKEADKSLLVGVYKHGYERYNVMRLDPALCFLSRCGPPDGAAVLAELNEQGLEDELDFKGAKDKDYLDDDYALSPGSPSGDSTPKPSTTPLPSEANPYIKSPVNFAVSGEMGKLPFPTASDLNGRLRRIITGYQRNHKKQEMKLQQRARVRDGGSRKKRIEKREKFEAAIKEREIKKRELQQRWSRREEADFYRTVSTFGVEYYPKEKRYEWSRFRALARLDRKYDDTLTEYFKAFHAMCKKVCGKPLAKEEEMMLAYFVEPITEERARRCLERVDLLNKIREEILFHPELDKRLQLCQSSMDLPDWWISGKHDKELLIGAAKHGLSHTDYHILHDPELSFLEVLKNYTQTKGMSEESEQLKMLFNLQDKSATDKATVEEEGEVNVETKPPKSDKPVIEDDKSATDDKVSEEPDTKIEKSPPTITEEKPETKASVPESSDATVEPDNVKEETKEENEEVKEEKDEEGKDEKVDEPMDTSEVKSEIETKEETIEEKEEEKEAVKDSTSMVKEEKPDVDVAEKIADDAEKPASDAVPEKNDDEVVEVKEEVEPKDTDEKIEAEEKMETNDKPKQEQSGEDKAADTKKEDEENSSLPEKKDEPEMVEPVAEIKAETTEEIVEVVSVKKEEKVEEKPIDLKPKLPQQDSFDSGLQNEDSIGGHSLSNVDNDLGEPTMAQLLAQSYSNPIRWPKDKVLQMRLENICHCVEKNEWPPVRLMTPYTVTQASTPATTETELTPRGTPDHIHKDEKMSELPPPPQQSLIIDTPSPSTSIDLPKPSLMDSLNMELIFPRRRRRRKKIEIEAERAKLRAMLHPSLTESPLNVKHPSAAGKHDHSSTHSMQNKEPPPAHQHTSTRLTDFGSLDLSLKMVNNDSDLTSPMDLSSSLKLSNVTRSNDIPSVNSDGLVMDLQLRKRRRQELEELEKMKQKPKEDDGRKKRRKKLDEIVGTLSAQVVGSSPNPSRVSTSAAEVSESQAHFSRLMSNAERLSAQVEPMFNKDLAKWLSSHPGITIEKPVETKHHYTRVRNMDSHDKSNIYSQSSLEIYKLGKKRRRPRVDPNKLDYDKLTGNENVSVINRVTGKKGNLPESMKSRVLPPSDKKKHNLLMSSASAASTSTLSSAFPHLAGMGTLPGLNAGLLPGYAGLKLPSLADQGKSSSASSAPMFLPFGGLSNLGLTNPLFANLAGFGFSSLPATSLGSSIGDVKDTSSICDSKKMKTSVSSSSAITTSILSTGTSSNPSVTSPTSLPFLFPAPGLLYNPLGLSNFTLPTNLPTSFATLAQAGLINGLGGSSGLLGNGLVNQDPESDDDSLKSLMGNHDDDDDLLEEEIDAKEVMEKEKATKETKSSSSEVEKERTKKSHDSFLQKKLATEDKPKDSSAEETSSDEKVKKGNVT